MLKDFSIGSKAPAGLAYGLVSGGSVYWPSGTLLPGN